MKSESCAGFLGVLVPQRRAVTFFRNLTGHLDSAIVGSRCRPNPSVTYPLCCHLCRRFRLNAGLQTPRKRLLIRRVPHRFPREWETPSPRRSWLLCCPRCRRAQLAAAPRVTPERLGLSLSETTPEQRSISTTSYACIAEYFDESCSFRRPAQHMHASEVLCVGLLLCKRFVSLTPSCAKAAALGVGIV